LIETALVEVDELVVLVYDSPRVTAVPLRVRCGWIRDLYPRVTVVEARGGPTEVGHTHGIKEAHERYVLEALGIRGVTHFYSGEFYGEHMSVALGAIDRRIDPERKQFPVSGSLIRQAPHRWREYIHPRVYRDLVVNVALLGAPSTGKTTLAERLALEYSTNWMPEYGREYWETHQVNRRLTPDQLVDIAEGHLESEEELLRCAKRFLFTDTNAITTLMFALDYHGGSPVRLAALARACVERLPRDPAVRDRHPLRGLLGSFRGGPPRILAGAACGLSRERRAPVRPHSGRLEKARPSGQEVLAAF
jgi:NadR type nicotinamide-nucleotide adenylyltransferase